MGACQDLAAVHSGYSMSGGHGVMQCHVCLCNTWGVAGPVCFCMLGRRCTSEMLCWGVV